jgi:D-3-phosphoglycerate dehydrogenase / 2-oxoglutarate reductase
VPEKTTLTDLKDCRVLVTPTSYGQHDKQLVEQLEAAVGKVDYNQTGRPLTTAELRDLLSGCDGFIAGLDYIDRTALEAADRLKVIARYGAGVDRIDLDYARARGIIVTNTPGANAVSVAELTVGLMLSLARMIPAANVMTHAGEWPRLSGVSLSGKVIGLIGFGAIGQAVARRLQGFGGEVIAADPFALARTAQEYGIILVNLDTVIARSDFLSLHVPVLPETNLMVNDTFLSCMKPGSFLINTARGELIDETALLNALVCGHLRGAALDCFSAEPPGAEHALLALPQVIVTPHAGAHTDDAVNAMGWGALNACLAVLRGETPAHRVV